MFLIFLFYLLGCSFKEITGEPSITIDPLSSPVQYVFNTSEVHLTWYFKTSGISFKPTVYLYVYTSKSYKRALLLIGTGEYVDDLYKNRLSGWRNMSLVTITIKNFNSDDFTNYKIRIEHTLVAKAVESVKTLQKGVKPTQPRITCDSAKDDVSRIIVKEGDDLECLCSATGLPLPNVVWKLAGKRSNSSVLKIKKISRKEMNFYTCVANNQYGFHNQSVLNVHVQYPPRLPVITSSNTSSYIGKKIKFSCTTDGDPAPVYSWITPENRILVTGTNSLVVTLNSSAQFGAYICIASNIHGNNTRNITLRQLLVPGKPKALTYIRKTFEITIRWHEPDDNGGSIITGYFIKVKYKTQVIANSKTRELQYSIDELQRNTTYTFCVTAENIVGTSNETCAEVSTLYEGPPGVSEPPGLSLNGDRLVVKWVKVVGNPDYYLVEHKTKEYDWMISAKQGVKILRYEIQNVVPGELYDVRILAQNKHGLTYGKVAHFSNLNLYQSAASVSTVTWLMTSTEASSSSSTEKPVLDESSDDFPIHGIIAIAILCGLIAIVAVLFIVMFCKRRSQGNERNQPNVEHITGPLGDVYAVVERKNTKKKDKNDRKDLVYAELSDFVPRSDDSRPPPRQDTDYADIEHVVKEQATAASTDNDYEDIPLRSDEEPCASTKDVERSNSISI
ncbi:neural cell adhesion molecule 1-B-like [Dendronephthya gigantea]|uniref:neural cell adhesion molecule 1-B-like n=1 Tax=Dendronephthya gigantea TaxID=151771 RepID=UPI001069A8B6|nr:neural cell adhesion molecule 1-B-like [Dendronephthya gigantea]